MKLIITEDSPGVLTATYIKERIKAFNPTPKKPFVLALPTGGTAVDMYSHLVSLYKSGAVSFDNVITFNLDEYVNFDTNNPQSYKSYMYTNFFSKVSFNPDNINIPNGNAKDMSQTAMAYEEKIKSLGGIELLIGGVGTNGHIAFNEPNSPINSRTRVIDLAEKTLRDNSKFFNNDINAVPKQAITMGLATISDAREVIIMATGQNKAEAVWRAIEGPKDIHWPITILQSHQNAYLVADKAASSEVSKKAATCGVCSFDPIK
ncbi:MAG: glucosamine-6-phosphate deaminase [Elusimicrobiota bacterium]|jgi:glucosamine-6-phosphate deaminase|nr:glucosamine-6-phosphate deaminase [Elusimicrobiota bacterium]